MTKKHILHLTLILILMNSCNNYRNAQRVDLQELENRTVLAMKNHIDTILTITEKRGNINSERYLATIYKENGRTYSFLNSNYYNYPDTVSLEEFSWNTIFRSIDSIQSQSPRPGYEAVVIEEDTTWYEMRPHMGDAHWIIYLYLPNKLLAWETSSFQMHINPSLRKTQVTEYLLDQTIYKLQDHPFSFGKPKKQK